MLRKRTDQKFVLAITLVLGMMGFALRFVHQPGGAPAVWATVILAVFSAAALLLAALSSLGVAPRPAFRRNYRRSPALPAQVLGALLLTVGAVLRVFTPGVTAEFWVGVATLVGALCLAACAAQTMMGHQPSPVLYMAAAAALFLKMIPQFRLWSLDPVIADYCFRLFAAIAALCLTFYIGGFALETGKRGITLFWSIACLFFSVVSLSGGGAAEVIAHLGWAVYSGAEVWLLLAKPKKRRRPKPAQPEPTQEQQ